MEYTTLGLALSTTLAWGVWSLLVKLATRSVPAEITMVLSYGTAVVIAVGYVLVTSGPVVPTGDGIGYAVLGGIFASVGAITFYMALSRGGAAVVTPVSSLYFVVAAVAGVVVLGESLETGQIAGIGCAVAAVFLITS